uniref:Uncharacterized protein n=1 Tax=Caenorhabditis japonica TaxID=281687 RepID=A0A8R1IW12_CAEJA
MRRAAGSHIRSTRQKAALLQRTTLSDKRIAPSLRSKYVKSYLEKQEQFQKPTEQSNASPRRYSSVTDRPPVTRIAPSR